MNQAPPTAPPRATLADLARVPGKAELIGGRIVEFVATGHFPSRIAARIFQRLDAHAVAVGLGLAFTDNVGISLKAPPPWPSRSAARGTTALPPRRR